MKKKSNTISIPMPYDEAIAKIESILQQLESTEAISMDDYRRLAQEATCLLTHCQSLLQDLSQELTIDSSKDT